MDPKLWKNKSIKSGILFVCQLGAPYGNVVFYVAIAYCSTFSGNTTNIYNLSTLCLINFAPICTMTVIRSKRDLDGDMHWHASKWDPVNKAPGGEKGRILTIQMSAWFRRTQSTNNSQNRKYKMYANSLLNLFEYVLLLCSDRKRTFPVTALAATVQWWGWRRGCDRMGSAVNFQNLLPIAERGCRHRKSTRRSSSLCKHAQRDISS